MPKNEADETSAMTAAEDLPAINGARRTWRTAMALSIIVIMIIGGLDLAVVLHNSSSGSGISPTAALMGLGDLPDRRQAPDFTLLDQHGQERSLSALRGKVVVLQFMDPHCTDICPIVSHELIYAARDLGSDVTQAAFVAVNVNPYVRGQSDVAAFSREQGLSRLPNWYFLTGSVAALARVWHQYGILVQAPSPTADVIHSSYIFFIGESGIERYIASPSDDHTKNGTAYLPASDLIAWGAGIAQVIRQID